MPDIFVAPQTIEPVQPKDNGEIAHPKPRPMSALASFADHPSGLWFATKADDEECELFLRRHFITNIPWIALAILLILTPPILFPLLGPTSPIVLPTNLVVVLLSFWYLIIFGFSLTSFVNWYFNVYIVTTERLIDVDFVNLLYREVSATRLNLIQDVTVKTGGVIQSIFHYGDVFIQTAGTEANFDFNAVPNPDKVGARIEKLMKHARFKDGESSLEEAIDE